MLVKVTREGVDTNIYVAGKHILDLKKHISHFMTRIIWKRGPFKNLLECVASW